MKSAQGRYRKRIMLMLGLSLVLLVAAFWTAGCGKKQPIETEMIPEETTEGWEVTPPPKPEEPVTTTPAPATDYAAMDPAEYGIEDVFFAFDVYALSTESMAILGDNARIMKQHADLVWLIEGHCDERGTVEYNLALGEKRAISARDYLVSLGVPARQLRITSYGEERPFAMGSTEAAWAKNRRAHFARP
jgi:peptidoglycan-associated lipoprotein